MARSLTKSSFRRNNASQAEDVLRFPLEENSFFKKVVIMKKTLAAVAVLGAFAGSALAADVTLYGKVDMGLKYTNVENEGGVKGADSDSYGLESGLSSGSRFGIKGSEQISEGLTVGFQLEHGFSADSGKFGDDDRMFNRESRLYVATDYGTFHFGRFGSLDSGTGSVDVAADLTASGTGYAGINDQSVVFYTTSRMDNSIAYTSPEFAGMTVSLMTSLKQDSAGKWSLADANDGKGTFGEFKDKGEEGQHTANRYHAAAVNGQWGAFGAGLIVSMVDPANVEGTFKKDDVLNVTAGVNYDFGVAKAYLAANYADQGETAVDTEKSQWGVSASVAAPLGVGELEAAVGYKSATTEVVGEPDMDEKVWTVGAYYNYPLSKRTYLYAGAGYTSVDSDDYQDDENTITVISGLCHNF